MRLRNYARTSTCALAFLIFALGITNVRFMAQEIWPSNATIVALNSPLAPTIQQNQIADTPFENRFFKVVPLQQAGSSNSTQQLQNAVHRLTEWLSRSKTSAEGWRRYLLLNVLETQSALGEQADIEMLKVLKGRFSGDVDGLDHPAFNDVLIALEEQVKHLSASQIADLDMALYSGVAMYDPISIKDMEYQRDLAIYELKLVIKYYRLTMPSRKRAELFFDLDIDNAIKLLGEIEFELAPEISAGKVNSLIKDVQKKFDDVEKKIDALPFVPEPDDEEPDEDKPAEDVPVQDEPADDNPTDDEKSVLTPTENKVDDVFNVGPIPEDGEQSREDLEREKAQLESQLEKLSEQRKMIRQSDRPRTKKRSATLGKLSNFNNKFSTQRKKLRDPYFASASLTFERFFLTYFYGTSDNLQEMFLVRLQDLQSDLREMEGPNGRQAAGKVGDALRWMENANQLPNIVTAIRARYSNPNLYIAVSSGLVNRFGSQSISETQPVRQMFDGKLIRGTASTNAIVEVEFQDDPNQIHANIHLTGSLNSNTYVETRGVKAYTTASGELEGRRSIYANIGGLFANDPKVAANVRTRFLGTSSRLRLINKIASKKFAELQSKGEGVTAGRAESLLLDQFGSQTDEPIENGKSALAGAQGRISSNASLAPELYARSFRQGILAVGKKSSISTLAAPNAPAKTFVPADIAVRIHETMLSNYLDSTFAGKKFSDKELAKEIGAIMGEAPKALTAKPKDGEETEDKSFTITFANVRPIQFEFEDNAFRIVVSGQRFEEGDKKIDAGLTIALRFKIKRVDGMLKLVRDGRAELDYSGEKSIGIVAFRSVLDGKLNPKKGGQAIEVELPENLIPVDQVEALKESPVAKRLRLIQCRAEKGWLYLGWNYVPESQDVAGIQDMPAVWSETIIQGMNEIYAQEDAATNSNVGNSVLERTIVNPTNASIAPSFGNPVGQVIEGTILLNEPIVGSPSEAFASPSPVIEDQLQR